MFRVPRHHRSQMWGHRLWTCGTSTWRLHQEEHGTCYRLFWKRWCRESSSSLHVQSSMVVPTTTPQQFKLSIQCVLDYDKGSRPVTVNLSWLPRDLSSNYRSRQDSERYSLQIGRWIVSRVLCVFKMGWTRSKDRGIVRFCQWIW